MRIKRATVVAIIILTLSMMSPSGLVGLGVAQPTSLYPVVVSLDTGETVFIAAHTSDLAGGNWIELSGGTSIQLPSLTLAYAGLDSATYVRDGVTITIESSFAAGGATYPLTTHRVYSTGQSITATFRGASSMTGPVDFRLISISSITDARDILTDAFQGDLAPLKTELSGATWSQLSVGLDGVGDATVTIPAQSVGNYLLVVVKQNAQDIYIDSATIIAVVDQTLDVTCPSSIQRGASLNVNTGLSGTYIHGAILIKETAYSGEVKLVTAGTVLSTELHLNEVEIADEAFVTESLSLENAVVLLNQLKTAFGSNQMAYGVNLISGSMSLSTSSLATGDYVLLVGVYNFVDSRIVGVYQKTVRITSPSAPAINRPPVAEAGPHQSAWVDETVYFDGSDSHDPDGYLISWDWSFGDGATAHDEEVTHEYSEPGNYLVTLTVKDSRHAVVSDTCVVEISEPPAPVSDEYSERVAGGEEGHVVDASDEANTTVTLNTVDPVTVTIIKYEGNPHPEDPIPATALPNYVDVQVSDPDAVTWPIYVEMSYTDDEIGDLDESTFGIYYWMDDAWQRCSNTGVDTDRKVVWAYMTAEEASGSPIVIAGTHAIIIPPLPPFLSDLTVTPSELEQGDDVTISLDIMNPNNQSITYIVTMKIGELTLLVDVELEALESKTVSRTLTMGIVGDYSVTVDGMAGNFVVNPPLIPVEPAEFVVSELEVQPDEVEVGEDVTFTVLVTNIGETEGSYIVEFRVDGEIVDTQIVTLAAASGRQAMAYYEALSAGTYQVSVEDLTEIFTVLAPLEPAEFEVSDLVLIPSEIEPGGTVIISAMVANVGETAGSYTVELKVDGETVETESVTLAGGTSQSISLTISSEEEGMHTVEVDGVSGSFTVESPPPDKFPWTTIILIVVVAVVLYLIWTRTNWIKQLLDR